ncbi:MAG: hypothetical protein AAF152_13870 [Cyanobacteria bacterium P01_A01_bin.114]
MVLKHTFWQISGLVCGSLLAGLSQAALPQAAFTQEEPLKPTARYALGEDVDLGSIIAEWREPYPDIPIFACVCDGDSCDHTERWPFREFNRYQLTVALGPFNANYTESTGFNCFDIETGQRPSADTETSAEPESENQDIPTVSVLDEGAALRLAWPDGQSNTIEIGGWNMNILNALDCEALEIVPENVMFARRILGEPAVDTNTGNVAVPILLNECVETQQTGVFIVEPQGAESYALYRAQVPGDRNLPDEFSSYPLDGISGIQYWDSILLVRHGSASGAEAILMFRPDVTPAGTFAGCGIISDEEGADRLCPD